MAEFRTFFDFAATHFPRCALIRYVWGEFALSPPRTPNIDRTASRARQNTRNAALLAGEGPDGPCPAVCRAVLSPAFLPKRCASWRVSDRGRPKRRTQAGRNSGKTGERCAMTTVHCAVHRFVHPKPTANFQKQKEMHSDKGWHSDAVWLGVGLERPRFHCHQMSGGRSSPTSQIAR